MELNLDEQALVADFRRLPAEGQKKVRDFAADLVKKVSIDVRAYRAEQEDRCNLVEKEERPELAGEPIFTE